MASPAPNWPDIQQMLVQLQTSGVLNPQAVPTGPIQPLPHPPAAQTPVHFQNLVGTTAIDHPEQEVKTDFRDHPLFHKATKFLGVLLSFEGMYGIYRSLQFLFVTYPMLERNLANHLISLEEVNQIAGHAIIELVSTIVGLLFAAKLTLFRTRAFHILHIVLGTVFFILNAMLMSGYLAQYDFIAPLTRGVFSLIDLSP
ncbi:MAG TPA: hypothetical protein VF209_04065 [Patescibacteria group bacterium]